MSEVKCDSPESSAENTQGSTGQTETSNAQCGGPAVRSEGSGAEPEVSEDEAIGTETQSSESAAQAVDCTVNSGTSGSATPKPDCPTESTAAGSVTGERLTPHGKPPSPPIITDARIEILNPRHFDSLSKHFLELGA